MGSRACPESADVTGRAGRRWEIDNGERARFRFPMPPVTAGHICDTVGRLLINLPLRVIRTDVACAASLRLASLLEAELVP